MPRRRDGPTERPVPAPANLLRWIQSRRPGVGPYDTIIVAATQMLWFYMMRIGEAASTPGDGELTDALRDEQVEVRRGTERSTTNRRKGE